MTWTMSNSCLLSVIDFEENLFEGFYKNAPHYSNYQIFVLSVFCPSPFFSPPFLPLLSPKDPPCTIFRPVFLSLDHLLMVKPNAVHWHYLYLIIFIV
jgi:hypothetical protein